MQPIFSSVGSSHTSYAFQAPALQAAERALILPPWDVLWLLSPLGSSAWLSGKAYIVSNLTATLPSKEMHTSLDHCQTYSSPE